MSKFKHDAEDMSTALGIPQKYYRKISRHVIKSLYSTEKKSEAIELAVNKLFDEDDFKNESFVVQEHYKRVIPVVVGLVIANATKDGGLGSIGSEHSKLLDDFSKKIGASFSSKAMDVDSGETHDLPSGLIESILGKLKGEKSSPIDDYDVSDSDSDSFDTSPKQRRPSSVEESLPVDPDTLTKDIMTLMHGLSDRVIDGMPMELITHFVEHIAECEDGKMCDQCHLGDCRIYNRYKDK